LTVKKIYLESLAFTLKEENISLEILDSGDPDLEKDITKQFYIHQSLAPVHQAYFTDE
jgi:hypothetical protein